MVIADPWRLQDRIKTHLQMAQPYSFNLVTAPTLQNWGQGPSLSSTAGLEDRSLLPGAGQDRTSPNLHQLVSTSNFYRVLDQIHHLSSVPISVLASKSVSGTESEILGQGPRSQSWSRQTSPLGKYVSLSLNSDSKVIIYSHVSNKRGGWNKRGGGAKVAKSINVEGGIFLEKTST